MTFCLGVAEAKLANNMVNQLAWGSKPSVREQQILAGDDYRFRNLQRLERPASGNKA